MASVNCTQSDGNLKYSHSELPTYEGNGTEIMVSHTAYMYGKGVISVDTVTLGGGVEIPHHPFVEADRFCSGPWARSVDTVLGLSMGSQR